jgi:hypothetical protein
MNQVETGPGILTRQAIHRGSSGSGTELVAMIDAFTEHSAVQADRLAQTAGRCTRVRAP